MQKIGANEVPDIRIKELELNEQMFSWETHLKIGIRLQKTLHGQITS